MDFKEDQAMVKRLRVSMNFFALSGISIEAVVEDVAMELVMAYGGLPRTETMIRRTIDQLNRTAIRGPYPTFDEMRKAAGHTFTLAVGIIESVWGFPHSSAVEA
ncbi:hypothetical protein HZB00_01295 [Candidatus Woesearchaeota archaeon]|nr:hypothetical protein [Candidatus Woesearchaeota archaeon]